MGAKGKTRLDVLLVRRGFAESRTRAQALIMAGKVVVGEHRVDKSGTLVDDQISVRVKSPDHPYVSRGGVKLAGALADFGLAVDDKIAIDVGASTGGFTDCLLQHGARRVYALDVGRAQLHEKLRRDPRVISREGINVRHLKANDLPEPAHLAVFDLSFISLRLVLPPILPHLVAGGLILAMVKPQFEVGKDRVGKGGIVRDAELRRQVVDDMADFAGTIGLRVLGRGLSQLPGADGNQEEFLYLALR